MVSRTVSRRGCRMPRSLIERGTIATTLVVWAVFFTVLSVRQPRAVAPPVVTVGADDVPDEVPYVPSEDPSFVTDDVWGQMEEEAVGLLSKRDVPAAPAGQLAKTEEGVAAGRSDPSAADAKETASAAEQTTSQAAQTAAPAVMQGSQAAAAAVPAAAAPAQPAAPAAAPAPAQPAAPAHAQPTTSSAAETPAQLATSSSGNSSPLSGQSAAEGTYSESEKAMFRNLFDWTENPTATCKRLMKFGGRIQAQGTSCPRVGHKYACLDAPMQLATTGACLVYSFSVLENNWSFDEAMAQLDCEVHTFNPRLDLAEGVVSPGVTFHRIGLGRNNHTNVNGWHILTLDQIVRRLGHIGRPITYLRANVDGSEFDMLAQQLLDAGGEFVLDVVEQMGLEVRFRPDPPPQMNFYRTAGRAVERLRRTGFNVVDWRHSQTEWQRHSLPGVTRPVGMTYEVLLVKNGADTWDRSSRGRPDDVPTS